MGQQARGCPDPFTLSGDREFEKVFVSSVCLAQMVLKSLAPPSHGALHIAWHSTALAPGPSLLYACCPLWWPQGSLRSKSLSKLQSPAERGGGSWQKREVPRSRMCPAKGSKRALRILRWDGSCLCPRLLAACCASCMGGGSSYSLLCLLSQPDPKSVLGPTSCLVGDWSCCLWLISVSVGST